MARDVYAAIEFFLKNHPNCKNDDIIDYIKRNFDLTPRIIEDRDTDDDDCYYVAIIDKLPGCITCGNDDDIYDMIDDAIKSWLNAAIENVRSKLFVLEG